MHFCLTILSEYYILLKSHRTKPNCVKVARQTLTLFVRVRILLRLPHGPLETTGFRVVFYLSLKKDVNAMRISSVIGLYFSPGTTRTLVTAAAEQAAQTLGVPCRLISLNTPADVKQNFTFPLIRLSSSAHRPMQAGSRTRFRPTCAASCMAAALLRARS